MDVEPPHQPIHSWRDALTHVGLMTVGLFIALMLEGVVDYFHHKELVRQARENIRAELEQNHRAAKGDIKDLAESGDKIKAGVKTLRFMEAHRNAHGQSIGYAVSFTDLQDAAWRTARDTGALGYMPLNEVQRYSSLYGLQENVTESTAHLLEHQAESLGPLLVDDDDKAFEHMSEQDFTELRKTAGVNYADTFVLQQLLRALDEQYVQALKQK